MVQPEKISEVLGKELIRRLENEEYIREDEELLYFREMQKIGKKDSMDIQTWAFYYALMKNETNALKYFRRSLYLGSEAFIENFLAYLLRTSRIQEFMRVTSRLRLKYRGDKSIMESICFTSLLKGDIEASRRDLEALIALKSDEMEKYQEYLTGFNAFIENSCFTEDDLKSLMDTYISIIEEHQLAVGKVVFDSSPQFKINDVEMMVYLPEAEINKIVDLDIELAFKLADIPKLNGKVFSASFNFYER